MSLGNEKYLLLTTFKRDGTPVATPVWASEVEGGKVGFYTSSGSGKAKRLAHTDRVTVQPCNARGKVKEGTSPVEGTARLVTGAEVEPIRQAIVAKYGVQTKIANVFNSIGGTLKRKRTPYADRGVIITCTAS